MEKEMKFFMGMDVSKLWVDIAVMKVVNHRKEPMVTERFDNNKKGMNALDKWLKKLQVSFNKNTLLVIENTGVYHRIVWEYCSANKLPINIGNAAHIKWSLGLVRGKNDEVDSQRLCAYACKNAEELKAAPVLNPVFIGLKDLMTSRSMLLRHLNSTKVYLRELKLSNSKETQAIIMEAHKACIEGLKASIKCVETEITKIIKENADIAKNYKLLISVPGIGHLTAVYIICCTNNFICKITGKQLSSYAGVAPFRDTSGTSIKGRNKVHKMANKELKKLLHMGALSAINHYAEFRDYYDRKKIEGKHPQAILNAIKSKLALRAVAVINNQAVYVNKYKKAA